MSPARRVPPEWVLSIPVATFGMVAGFIIVTLPQILAAQNVPGGHIAVAVAVITSPGFWIFLVAPILDVRFRRRTYALVFGLLAVFGTAFTVFITPQKRKSKPSWSSHICLSPCMARQSAAGPAPS
ncbi:MAG TPA: hypothetical protein VE868_10765 [Balneolaceae bacterium]|nr:hypothetical protein [Balneolaceae bacterium]